MDPRCEKRANAGGRQASWLFSPKQTGTHSDNYSESRSPSSPVNTCRYSNPLRLSLGSSARPLLDVRADENITLEMLRRPSGSGESPRLLFSPSYYHVFVHKWPRTAGGGGALACKRSEAASNSTQITSHSWEDGWTHPHSSARRCWKTSVRRRAFSDGPLKIIILVF